MILLRMTGQFSAPLEQCVRPAALLGLSFRLLLLQTELDSANVTWEYFNYGETVHAFTEPDLVNTGSVSHSPLSTEQGHGSAVLGWPCLWVLARFVLACRLAVCWQQLQSPTSACQIPSAHSMVDGAALSTSFPLSAYPEMQACLVSELEAACSSLMVLSCLPSTHCTK